MLFKNYSDNVKIEIKLGLVFTKKKKLGLASIMYVDLHDYLFRC